MLLTPILLLGGWVPYPLSVAPTISNPYTFPNEEKVVSAYAYREIFHSMEKIKNGAVLETNLKKKK